jgi:hypothetical protein
MKSKTLFGPEDAYIPGMELGLRSDGVVVWREVEEQHETKRQQTQDE